MLLRPEIICLRIYRIINITKVTVHLIHISNRETQKYNFGVETSLEDWGRRVTLQQSTRIQSVRQKVEWTSKRSCPIVSSGTGSVESLDFTTTVSNYKGHEQLCSTLKRSKQDKHIIALPLSHFHFVSSRTARIPHYFVYRFILCSKTQCLLRFSFLCVL